MKLWTLKALNCLLLVLAMLTAPGAEASYVSNEALFQRAHKSYAFWVLMSGQDPAFVSSLSPLEKQLHYELLLFTSAAQTYNWARERKLETLQLIELTNTIKPLSVTSYAYPPLQFSKDDRKFKLRPDEPVRSAITTAEGPSPIWININKVNQLSLTLGDATSLLTHEMAHKLQKPGMQSAIDSLAAKMKNFVDQKTIIQEFEGFKVHTFNFSKAPIYGWLYDLFAVKPAVNPKWIFDQEGFYILVENEKGFQDITLKVLEPFLGSMKVNYDERNLRYQLERLHWYLSDWIRIESENAQHLKVSYNLNYYEAVVPFMKKTSEDPIKTKPYHNEYMGHPFDGGLVGAVQELEIQGLKSKVVNSLEGLIRHVDPSYQVKLLEQKWMGEDLKLVFKIEGPRLLQFPGFRMSDMEIWPELLFQFEGQTIEVKASKETSKDEFTFIIPRLKNANHGTLILSGLEWGSKKPNLVHGGSSSRVSSFINQPLQFELSGTNKKPELKLEKIIPKGEFLELQFQSDETLRTLDIHQGIFAQETSTHYNTTDNGIRYEVATHTRHFEGMKAIVRFDESQMVQKKINGKLSVTVHLDRDVETELEILSQPNAIPEINDKIKKPDEETLFKTTLNPNRWFLAFKAQTESLGVFEEQLQEPLLFPKAVPIKNSCKKVID